MPAIKADEEKLLVRWEETYKKGLLTFWLLLFLHERPAYAYEAGNAVAELSQQTITVDENSVYRALNRFVDLGLVRSELRDSEIGPRRKYYRLTRSGTELLAGFIRRNILLFDQPALRERIRTVLADEGGEERSI
jgi:PadR family transcriptional regulator PadR